MDQAIEIVPLSGALGAEISGVQIGGILSNEAFDAIYQAFHDYGAVFFRDQDLTHQAQIDFARRFGELEQHPIVDGMEDHPEIIKVLKPAGDAASFGTGWHSDNSFLDRPSQGSVLYGVVVPPHGGDTLFANQYLAFEALSDGLKRMLEDFAAVHSAGPAFTSDTAMEKYEGDTAITYTWTDAVHDEVEHPVVRTHPDTGRKALYVNPMFTQRFSGWTVGESRPLLDYLYAHATKPEFCCRFLWQERSVALWDNRCVQHYAVDDYRDFERVMYRVTIRGERPH